MKAVWIHLALALGGLVWAYQTWTAEDETSREEEVTVFDCVPSALGGVIYTSENREVDVARRDLGGQARWWISSSRSGEDEEVELREFLASEESMEGFIEAVAPLRASRDLGEVDEEMAEELELSEATTSISIRCGERSREFQVGGTAFGSGNRYMREGEDGHVYLVASSLLRDLQSPTNLMQRDLVDAEFTEVETLEVEAFDQSRTLQHRNRLDDRNSEWVDVEDPTRRNELFTNWVGTFRRLRAHRYVASGSEPVDDVEGEATTTRLATLRFKDESGETLEEVELVRVNVEGQAAPLFYARSGATHGWVRLLVSVARQVETDLRPLVGLEPEAEPEPEPQAEAEADEAPETEAAPEPESAPEPEAPPAAADEATPEGA